MGRATGCMHDDAESLHVGLTLDEVKARIKRLRRNKKEGVDEIPNEMFMAGGEEFVKLVRSVLQFIWVVEEVPAEWAVGLVTPLFKGGDKHSTDDYRGITLLCTLGKVYARVHSRCAV